MAFELRITGQTIKRIILGLIIGAVLGGLIYLAILLIGPDDPFDGRVDTARFQAVFLSDGRVYFGHLREAGDEFYELRDAFFIQEVPPREEDAVPTQEVRPITTEFHGPEDRMLIAKEFVVVVENLRPDSEVAAAIRRVTTAG